METEAQLFDGWSKDDQTARTYAPIKYRNHIKGLFYLPFGILIGAGILKGISALSPPPGLVFACLACMGISIGLAVGMDRFHKKAPTCPRCGRPMKLTKTLPSPQDVERHHYMVGLSGHVYQRSSMDGAGRVDEVQKRWYICPPCKSYVWLDLMAMPLGRFPDAMEQREADYKRFAQQKREVEKMLKAKK